MRIQSLNQSFKSASVKVYSLFKRTQVLNQAPGPAEPQLNTRLNPFKQSELQWCSMMKTMTKKPSFLGKVTISAFAQLTPPIADKSGGQNRSVLALFLYTALLLLLILIWAPSAQAQSCSIAGAEAQYTFEGTTNDVSGATVHNPTSIGTGISFSTDAIEGTNSATYDGTGGNGSGIVIDDAFFNAAFTTRTMSMFIKPTVLNIGQTLYEEGGLNNGIELRLTSGGNLILFVTEGGVVRKIGRAHV